MVAVFRTRGTPASLHVQDQSRFYFRDGNRLLRFCGTYHSYGELAGRPKGEVHATPVATQERTIVLAEFRHCSMKQQHSQGDSVFRCNRAPKQNHQTDNAEDQQRSRPWRPRVFVWTAGTHRR